MKRSRFSEQQIAFILHQAEEGVAVGDVCRKADLSLDKAMLQDVVKESFEACSGPAAGRVSTDQLPDQHPACLWRGQLRPLRLHYKHRRPEHAGLWKRIR